MAAGKTWQAKAEEACPNCSRCNGNFPINPEESQEPDLIEEIISEISEIYARHQAGCQFDFKTCGYVKGSFFSAFSKAMEEVERIQKLRMQAFLKAWLK